MSKLDTDIKFLKGVGEKRALILRSMGIDTIGALLRYYPRAYEDFKNITKISDCFADQKVCVRAKIITPISENRIRSNMTVYKFTVTDGSANMGITIFNNKYLAARLHQGSEYLFFGKLQGGVFLPEMSSPEIREVGHLGITPIYPAAKGMNSAAIERLVKTALASCEIPDVLPEGV